MGAGPHCCIVAYPIELKPQEVEFLQTSNSKVLQDRFAGASQDILEEGQGNCSSGCHPGCHPGCGSLLFVGGLR